MMVRNSACCTGLSLAMLTAVTCWTVLCGAQTPAATDGLGTSAEYIVGFVRHVRWPGEERLPAWRVCVVGELPHEQQRAYVGRVVRDRPFAVSYLDAHAPISDCEVLDLTATGNELAREVLSRARKLPVLAVGSGSAFCSAGGQICLHLDGDGARSGQKFEVNLSTIKESALEVSARLLSVGAVRRAGADLR